MTNALVAAPTDSRSAFSGLYLVEDGQSLASAIQSGSWVQGGMAAFSTGLDTAAAVIDPIGTLVAHGLSWLIDHFDPLKTWFDELTGSADEVRAFAQTWENVAGRLHDVAGQMTQSLSSLQSGSGSTMDAYRAYVTDAAKHLDATASWASAVSSGLTVASQLVQIVHDLIRDVLSQLVGMAVSALTEAVLSLGTAVPGIVAQIGTRVSELATRIGTTVTRLLESLKSLKGLLQPLTELLQRAHGVFAVLPPGGAAMSRAAKATEDVVATVSRIKPSEVLFTLGKGHNAAEFERQLAGQQKGLNKLTVQEFLDNRAAYLKRAEEGATGRAPEGNAAQKLARQDAADANIKKLMQEDGLSYKDAKAQTDDWMKTQAALHDPDQIAGGFADRITGMGDTGINSSIGSQWKTRIGELHDDVAGQAAGMTPEQLTSTYLNVTLTRAR